MNKLPIWCLLTCLVVSIVSPSFVAGQDSKLVVRSSVDPAEKALVGQRVKLTIDVLAEDAWATLERVPNIQVDGAIVFLPSSSSLRLNESIDGNSYTGQRYEWWIYPRRKGPILIEPVELDVNAKVFGAQAESKATKEMTEPIELIANFPEGVPAGKEVVSAESLTFEEEWDPAETKDLKVGDGVTHTITRTIEGAPGMLLPGIQAAQIDGVRAYPKQPSVDDKSNRGSLVGKRIDSVTYVFESAGTFTIPSEQFVWWNERSKRLETTEMPERIFKVVASGEAVTTEETSASSPDTKEAIQPISRTAWIILFIALAVAALIYFSRDWLKQKYEEIVSSPIVRERQAFQSLIAAAQSKDTNKTFGYLYRWVDFVLDGHQAPQLETLLDQFGENVDATEIRNLVLPKSKSDFNEDAFVSACRQIRRNWRARSIRLDREKSTALPNLNP